MNKSILLILLLSIFFSALNAQKIYGVVRDDNGNLLPYASIVIKGTSSGVTANNKADYSFSLPPGKYILVCQHVGYESIEMSVDLSADMELNFTLHKQQLLLKELIIKSGEENPAYEIIRQAIKKRTFYNNQVNSFDCDLYSKDLIKLRNLPNKIMGKKMPEEDRKTMGLDSSGKGIIYLSEAISKVYVQQPDKFKLDVKSSRVSGSNSFGFTFPSFINLYENNVSIFNGSFGNRGYVSPIADGALRFYKYKILGTFMENGKIVNAIKVIPRRNYEPLFSGIINITDEDWRIQSFDLTLTKQSQLEFLDTLKITQLHVPVSNDIWRVKDQLLYFNFNMFKIDVIGHFLTVYSNYNVNRNFDKKFFDRIVIKYDTAVNKKMRQYWDSVRPVPLELEEKNDYRIKDSLFALRSDSLSVYNNIDSLRKKQGKFKIQKVLFSNIDRNHFSKTNPYQWGIESLIGNLQYNTAEGVVGQLGGYYEQNSSKRKYKLFVQPNIRYGFANTHLNSWVDIAIRSNGKNKMHQNKHIAWFLSGGKRVSQYNNENPVEPLLNFFSTLFSGKNIMKTYEKSYGGLAFRKRYESGLSFTIKTTFEDRTPLFNSSTYTFKKADSVKLTENYPVDRVSLNEVFHHQALLANIEISFRPGQRYIQFPDQRMPLGSKYPLFTLSYTKGIATVLGSDVDFDKWNLDIKDDMNFKLGGLFKYKLSVGGFLNTNKVFIQDYTHFFGNPLRASLDNGTSFQLMGSYVNSNTDKLYLSTHVEHHFNGLVTNKIPLIKKWNWGLITGLHSYYISNANHYEELYVGLENIFKLMRVDFVSAYQNGRYVNSALVFGAGGVLSGGLNNRGNALSRKRSIGIIF